ncbi:MAG TPA: glycosyltransferase family 4 protein [Thermoanaerobaculia bacterium]|nr:glycosyltransferase family 4 protein [Thermoanaerobaculia bacterium]
MRVLLYSPAFKPSIGGLETVVAMLAENLTRFGVDVVVITTTSAPERDCEPYRVVRQPSASTLLRWTRWCDVYYQANVSLRGLWPLLFLRRPWVVSHHSWYRRTDGRVAWQDRIKKRLLYRAAASISVSSAIAGGLGTPSIVVPNAYRDELFRRIPGIVPERDLIFVGRLVSDKGADLLLEALALLREQGQRASLTVVGSGPEEPALRAQIAALDLDEQVALVGPLPHRELVPTLNRHRILVVPSRYEEPFGIVALEGIACGCVVVASEGGGLPEAIGPCGVTFPNGDVPALADRLQEVLGSPDLRARLRARAAEHLAEHSRGAIALRHLEILRSTLSTHGRSR